MCDRSELPKMPAFRCGPIASIFVLFFLCNSIQLASTEDIIWYQGSSGYFTNHKYVWQGTTDGKSAPNVLLASALNQPWLVALGKSSNMIYFTDTNGVIGAWNVTSRHSSFVYQFDIGSWREDSGGPALTGLDLDEFNNHLYFSFNTSIYRLDLSQANPSPELVASFNNLVFNPRVSSSRGALYFCIRSDVQEQGDLVKVSLSDPTSVTTLVHNTSTGSIVQQLYIDETAGVLYYNSPGTLTMRGVSLTAPYNEVFSSVTLGVNPSFFDFNPTTSIFVFGDLRFSTTYAWSPNGPTQPTNIYSTSEGRVTGVKFFDDTHVLVAYQFSKYPSPNEGKLVLVNINDPSDTSVIAQNFGMGLSLIFDEKYCDFYYVANPNNRTSQTIDHVIFRNNIKEDGVDVYKRLGRGSEVLSIAFDANKRNLIDNNSGTINYSPIDDPSAPSVPIIDAEGRGVITYVVNEKNGDIYYADMRNSFNIYQLEASSISKDWIDNVGHLILSNLGLYNTLLTVDSVNNKLYFLNNSRGVFQSNVDGSDTKLISDLRNVVSMKWDPSTNRLFMISTPYGDWHLMSMNGDGSDVLYTPLKVPYSSGRAPFSNVNPDPFSDWVYLNADFYQPYRIKKDGSVIEPLYSYVPFRALSTIHYDGSSGVLYYGDTYCSIKKINLNNINKHDPAATSFDMIWQGNFIANKLAGLFFDKTHQLFWLLQTEVMTTSKSTYNVSVTPVNGGATKQLYVFPKDVYPPWTIDTTRDKMFAYSYHNRFPLETDQAIVLMDLYNGSNLQRVKEFKYPDYNHIRLTAMTLDSRTGVVYYALEDSTTSLESFDPTTSTTKRLWHAQVGLFITDIKVNASLIAMASSRGGVYGYDLNSGKVKVLNATTEWLSLDPNGDTIYMGGTSIQSMNINEVNGTQTTLLNTLKVGQLSFDFANQLSYFTLEYASGEPRPNPPIFYRSNLDGTNKKRIQLEKNSLVNPNGLDQFSFADGKLYTVNGGLDSFDVDGSGYGRIIQNTAVRGMIQFDDASQRVYWQENYGLTFYGCAVYSNQYADCQAVNLNVMPGTLLNSFVVGNGGLVYMTALYQGTIYSLDLTTGTSLLKIFVKDDRLYYANNIAMNKSKSALFVTTLKFNRSDILRISLDGSITTLYSNVSVANGLLLTDLTHCNSIQLASTEDIIWHTGILSYRTAHKYAWQGTTDGKSAPNVVIASALDQPWLVALGKSNHVVYFTDTNGVIGSWLFRNVTSSRTKLVHQFNISSWWEHSGAPALTGLDLDEFNNFLYFSFNTSIYRLDLSQANPSLELVASFNNLVFNPRVSSSRGALYFCLQKSFQQGDLVQVSLSDPTSVTTLVRNMSSCSVDQQLYIDEAAGVLYYNRRATLKIRGVSLNPPYNEVFSTLPLGVNPSFFDFNPRTSMFVFGDQHLSNTYTWSANGPTQPTNVFNTSEGQVTGVKFFDDTHVLVAYQFSKYINNSSDVSVISENFGLGASLLFDEKYCDFYFVANPPSNMARARDHLVYRKNINEDSVDVIQRLEGSDILSITLDTQKRNLIENQRGRISYYPIDDPSAPSVPIISADGRGVITYTIADKTGDIFYSNLEDRMFNIYRLNASSISTAWINNAGERILENVNYPIMTVDSVNNKLYFTNTTRVFENSTRSFICQSNFDGSDIKTVKEIYVNSMKWDKSTNRLYILEPSPTSWQLTAMKGDGSDMISTPLRVPWNVDHLPFSDVNPDPHSDWVYFNSFVQPLRMKKDASLIEPLHSYVPFGKLSTIHYDKSSEVLYYGDYESSIKKVNVNNINKDDPAATPFDVVWKGNYFDGSLEEFFFDRKNKIFWLLQMKVGQSMGVTPNYTVSVTPVNGGPTKQLYTLPKNVHPPWAIDVDRNNMFAFSYTGEYPSQQDQAIIMMDLYNGSNGQFVKKFKYPDYNSQVSVTAMTIDPRTGVIYYTLYDFVTTILEAFDPASELTERIWYTHGIYMSDIKLNDSSIYMASHTSGVFIYDLNSGNVKVLNGTARWLSLDPTSSMIYTGDSSIQSMNASEVNGKPKTLLNTLQISHLSFDFDNNHAYFTLAYPPKIQPPNPPFFYLSNLDGTHKKKVQLKKSPLLTDPDGFERFSFANGKLYSAFYVPFSGLNSINVDGTEFTQIIHQTAVIGQIQFDDTSQRVYWQEGRGNIFYSCAVYSSRPDCLAIVMDSPLSVNSFVIGSNDMVYASTQGDNTIYSMNLHIGASSLKVLVKDDRLYGAVSITMDKSKSALFVTTSAPAVLRISLDGTITPLYTGVGSQSVTGMLITDLTHCK